MEDAQHQTKNLLTHQDIGYGRGLLQNAGSQIKTVGRIRQADAATVGEDFATRLFALRESE